MIVYFRNFENRSTTAPVYHKDVRHKVAQLVWFCCPFQPRLYFQANSVFYVKSCAVNDRIQPVSYYLHLHLVRCRPLPLCFACHLFLLEVIAVKQSTLKNLLKILTLEAARLNSELSILFVMKPSLVTSNLDA